jgi:hypothetical protein
MAALLGYWLVIASTTVLYSHFGLHGSFLVCSLACGNASFSFEHWWITFQAETMTSPWVSLTTAPNMLYAPWMSLTTAPNMLYAALPVVTCIAAFTSTLYHQHPSYRGFTASSPYPHQLSAASRVDCILSWQHHLSGASPFLLCLPPTDPVGGCYWRCRYWGGGAVSCSPGPERGRSIIDFLVKYITSAWATNLWGMTSQIHHSEFHVSFVLPTTLIGYRSLSEPLSFWGVGRAKKTKKDSNRTISIISKCLFFLLRLSEVVGSR